MPHETPQARALQGLRVVDMSQVLAGPFCTMLLGDLGADVVKVEVPSIGDLSRSMHPRLSNGLSGAFLTVNRNKRSVAINLKSTAGVAVFRRLVETADVLVENYRPGITAKLGVDYSSMSDVNDRLIYCSISGFGQTGPYASRGGFDLIAQGMTGLMSTTGVPGGEPVKCGIPVTDLGAGLFAVYGILAALQARHLTGRGQHVDTSLLEAGMGLTVWESTEYFYTGVRPQPTGSAHRLSAPYQAFRTRDGYITVGADGERHWPLFCDILGLGQLSDDPRFKTNSLRLENLRELEELVESETARQDTTYWLERFEAAGVPAGPINGIPEALADPQVNARQMVQDIVHPFAGRTRTLGPVVKLSETPAIVDRPAPVLGEHTDEVLGGLGYGVDQLRELRSSGAVA